MRFKAVNLLGSKTNNIYMVGSSHYIKRIVFIIPILCLNNGIYAGIFSKFKDEKGNFKKDSVSNVGGMLCLYEAANLRIHGKDKLDEALAFTTTHLRSMVEHLKYHLKEQVAHALNRPVRRGVDRLEARWYMTIYHKACQVRFQSSAVPTQGGAEKSF